MLKKSLSKGKKIKSSKNKSMYSSETLIIVLRLKACFPSERDSLSLAVISSLCESEWSKMLFPPHFLHECFCLWELGIHLTVSPPTKKPSAHYFNFIKTQLPRLADMCSMMQPQLFFLLLKINLVYNSKEDNQPACKEIHKVNRQNWRCAMMMSQGQTFTQCII